ncbi:MAG: hypothetical protein IPP80_09845 [Ignavibacteria bacterium]|nr:hypothetical protein [Ignavibacteria bacterium]
MINLGEINIGQTVHRTITLNVKCRVLLGQNIAYTESSVSVGLVHFISADIRYRLCKCSVSGSVSELTCTKFFAEIRIGTDEPIIQVSDISYGEVDLSTTMGETERRDPKRWCVGLGDHGI